MKKLFFAIAAVAMVFATSCQKENVNEPEVPAGDNEFICVIDQNANPQNAPMVEDGMGTMAHIDGNNNVWWQQGDKIMYIGQQVNAQGGLDNPDKHELICSKMSDNRAYFSDANKHFGQGTHEAYYPSSLVTGGYYSISKYISYKSLPATINLESGKNAGFLPMYGTGSGTHYITFTNICAVLKINMPSSEDLPEIVNCNQLVVSATEHINGDFTVSSTQPYKAQLGTSYVDANKTITVNAPSGETFSGAVYVAIPEGTYNNFTVKLKDKNNPTKPILSRKKDDAMTVYAGKIYPVTLKTSSAGIPENAFYFKAGTNGATIKLSNVNSCTTSPSFMYIKEGDANWSSYNIGDQITVAAGKKLYFRQEGNDNIALASTVSTTSAASKYYHFYITNGTADIGGDLMYLINEKAKDNGTTPDKAFAYLFYNEDNLCNISNLIFPDTTVSANCFQSTFEDCHNLTSTKIELKATVGKASCYYSMFKNCTTLVANSLTIGLTDIAGKSKICYGMFDGCASLAPTNAITLSAQQSCSASCYREMFMNCTNLACSVTINITSNSNGSNCMENMFKNCSKLSSVSLPYCTSFTAGKATDWLSGAGTSLTPTTGTQVGTVHCKSGVQSNVNSSLTSAGDLSHTWSSSADQ